MLTLRGHLKTTAKRALVGMPFHITSACRWIDPKSLQVSRWAAKNCVLLMWAVDPLLHREFEVIDAWGFDYKTVGFYWVKTNKSADFASLSEKDFFTGLGYWTRANVEQCLLATRGNPPRMAKDVRRLIIDRRREHSRKPEQVYARIERLAKGPYLELFARETRPGWEVWGDQAQLFDAGPVKTRNRPSNMSVAQKSLFAQVD